MADGEVTFLIRSPSLKQEDKEIRVLRSYTVRELKTRLRREFPGEPKEEEQRLIYSGKLLPDHLKLAGFLSTDDRHVLHLVCATRSPPQTQAQDKKPQPGSPAGTSQMSSPPTEGLRQRNVPQSVSAAAPSARPYAVNAAFSPYAVYSPQQMLWLQQMYARQYYMQYYAAAAATNTSSHSHHRQEIAVVPAAAPDPLPHHFPADNQPQNPQVQPPVNPAANPNMRMNAQGGLVEEEDDINRDWLDWVYTAARFSIFLSILYFYSSLSRFMMVLGAMIVMYLHHAGWFPFRQRPPQDVNPLPQAAPNQQDQNNNLQENDDADDDFVDRAQAATLQTQSFVTTAWIFFKTFFASLIPEGPPAVVQ
ncbi:homocysteine-responsive endoplasmic reticulum-resident ubiquitin-like domain member 1 protein [Spea bombifrons]|uniref:homocysteine-responsive endoplasmic reticulum-resident ubiquitin-like domain member 1 protein n=1 Tax=Spea bombifrons TaxID=233779 RepID=UPI00234AA870|nr:homocysteine-responsive endoplasmic reticulum-resident ubiquitin-like domain member 1 protein [Spea bombifrons]